MDDLERRTASALGDRYTIERELGRGGVATVYLATDHKHGRHVAVKVLDPEVGLSIGPERFLKEIEIASRLTHPNILPLYDSGAAGGLLFYVMPYVDGESLRERLDRAGQLSLEETVTIVRAAAAALSVAHRRGIVHRDIKPENILLTAGQAIVADFGIAQAVDAAGAERLTATGLAIGTPAYMSPEQVGAERRLDGRSDVYSLGCVAYEMLAGEPPFSGSSSQALMARHVVDPVPPLRTLRPSVPPGMERAVERALSKVPVDRFETADAFAEALARGRAEDAEELAASGNRRAPRRGGWAAAALLGVVALAIGLWRLAGPGASAIRRFAVLPFDAPTLDPGQVYLAEGIHEAVISQLADEGLGVIARTSVLQYRQGDKPVREIGRELGVDALVEASLTRSSDTVRVEARLVDARTQQYVWSHPYAAALTGLPSLAVDVAHGIAGAIDPALAERGQGPRRRPVDPEAYDLYLKGQSYVHRPTRADLETARDYFERALAVDSSYALAWAGLSTYWTIGRQRAYFTPQEASPPSEAAAYRALALDSTLAEPHHALAEAKVYGEWDWIGGEREFRRAIALRPDYAEARAFYAHLLCILQRPKEALRQLERARELDPLDPLLAWIDGATLTMLGRYDDAIALYRSALDRSPGNPSALWLLWLQLHLSGRHAEAYPVLRQWTAASGDSTIAAALEEGYRRAGYEDAVRAVADLEAARAGTASTKTPFVAAWDVAIWYAAAGERDNTLDWLERAYREHDPTMPYLGVHPAFGFLHDDARFRELMQGMNLPE